MHKLFSQMGTRQKSLTLKYGTLPLLHCRLGNAVAVVYAIMGLASLTLLSACGNKPSSNLKTETDVTTIETDKRWMMTLGLLALLSMVGRYILVYQASEETPEVFSYLGPYAVFPAIFIFLLFKKLFKGDKCAHPFWESLSSKSLGVYLIHTALISVIGKAIHREEVLFIPVAIASVYLLSVVIVHIMQKNRLLRHLVP